MGEYSDLFTHNLKRIIERRKYTYRQVAEMVDTSDVMLSRWINGHHMPSEQYIDKLAEVLEVEMIEFFRPIQVRKIRTLRDQNEAYVKRKAAKKKAPRKPKEPS